ncbi:hypothetical protein [Phenylobacterium sp.]|uniref:hypothetical protein n=1 Tax=Phenylobacterium sp. TaxID=1871053 RepID=UPI00286B3897|nr:hypothetical protein [Phenylobacterium sp.]
MTPQRFEILAQAYGGDVARWPSAEREAAGAMMIEQPDLAAAALARAGELDALMDAWTPVPVSHALRERVIAAAPPPRARNGIIAWFWGAGLGAGLAAACAAGLVVGVEISNVAQPDESVSAALDGYDDLTTDLTGDGA